MFTITSQNLLIILLSAFAVFKIFTEGKARWYKHVTEQAANKTTAETELKFARDAIRALAKSLDESNALGSDTTKLLAGTIKACESIAASALAMKEEISEFRRLIVKKEDPQYPEDNFTPPASDEQAARSADFFANLLRGMPVAQAEQETKDAEEKKMMLSAISMGPMEE